MTRRWVVRQAGEVPAALRDLRLAPLFERVLVARGLLEPETVRRFCEPKLTDLHDPALMPGVETASARLVQALRDGESIVIYGDYDVDGITATAILFHTLRCIDPEARVRSYVPHRLDEGYGLNAEALQQLRQEGADLVVSVDCGVTGRVAAAAARAAGLDLIVTDHHHVPADPADLPDAVAIVHPRLPGSAYPFGELCGAGVAFKLAWRVATDWCGTPRVSESLQRTLLDMLPLAALGTIADVVPLVDENRIIASVGLQLIRRTPLPGLQALIEASDLADATIDSQKVGFVLGPRLNACGRMGHAADAVRMLTDAGPDEAQAIAARLAKLNEERRRTQRAIADEALAMAEEAGMTGDGHRAVVLAHPDWHPGVVGIVCSRLVDQLGRPAVLLQRRGDTCRGSARSIDGYSIHAALTACAEHLEAFGGHQAAAGLTLETARLEAFTEALVAHANAHIRPEQLTPALAIDCDAALGELDVPTVERIGTLSPFGRENRAPTLRVRGAVVAEPARPMGGHGRHLQVRLRQDDERGRRRVVRAVWWGAGELAASLPAGARLDAAIEPRINAWNGRTSVEAEIRDVILHG
ncbi:MAG: single-stranded-DNA-specific exonuclease RecJ [Planctomycetota bacterium]